MQARSTPTRQALAISAQALLLLAAPAVHAQTATPPGKAYIDQIPRNLPPLPPRVVTPGPAPAAAVPAQAAAKPQPIPPTPAPIQTSAAPRPQAPAPATNRTAPAVAPKAEPSSPPAPAAPKPVQATAPKPAAAPVQTAAAPKPAGGCRIQAGVFSQQANADKLASVMKPLGDVHMTEMSLKGKVAYSVILTGLPTRKDAESALAILNARKLGELHIWGCAS